VTTGLQPRFLGQQNIKVHPAESTIFALLALGETMVVVSGRWTLCRLGAGSLLRFFQPLRAGARIPSSGLSRRHRIGCGMRAWVKRRHHRPRPGTGQLVVTLATLYIIRGIDISIVSARVVASRCRPTSWRSAPTRSSAFRTSPCAWRLVIAAGAYFLRSFRSGRELYAIGSNPDAARLVGIPIGRRVFSAYVASGAIDGLAGVLWATYYGRSIPPRARYESDRVVTGGVVGGVSDLRR